MCCIPSLLIMLTLVSFQPVTIHAEGLEDLSKDDLVQAIKSVEQVKEALGLSIQKREECGIGSCWNYWSQHVCELVGALDLKTNGLIIGDLAMKDFGIKGMPISERDLELMKLIFQQCKPTTYQYWNFESILHVVSLPLFRN